MRCCASVSALLPVTDGTASRSCSSRTSTSARTSASASLTLLAAPDRAARRDWSTAATVRVAGRAGVVGVDMHTHQQSAVVRTKPIGKNYLKGSVARINSDPSQRITSCPWAWSTRTSRDGCRPTFLGSSRRTC
jgi:hypothetical protein